MATGAGAAAAVLLALSGMPRAAAAQTAADAPALRREAERLRSEQRFPEALAAYRGLAALDSASFEDRFWLAKLEGWTGRLEAAESDFVRLLAERPGDYDSRIALADVRMWRGRVAAARVVLEDLHRTHPADPEVLSRLETLRRRAPTRWEADVEYFGERLPAQPATHGATLSVGACSADRLRWRAAATLQEKFARTESRFGGEVGYRVARPLELQWSAQVAPGAEVLPRQSYGVGLGHQIGRGLVLSADYTFLDYRDAEVHQAGPELELYLGRHWLLTGRYRYSSTRFSGAGGTVGNHAGAVSLGYLYGDGSLLRGFAGAGAESFAVPSRDVIGDFEAHTVGGAWRHFLTPRLGFEVVYAHQDRSDGTNQDSYGLRLVQRW